MIISSKKKKKKKKKTYCIEKVEDAVGYCTTLRTRIDKVCKF